MPRSYRILADSTYYHLIARGNNRLFLFSIPGGFLYFKKLLLNAQDRFSWKMMHYCLMTNHIHLLGRMEKGEELPRLMQYLLWGYAWWYKRETGYRGHLWEGRYKSFIIEDDRYFLECGRYIERNPVRAGIVPVADDYIWSSYRHYAYGERDILINEENPYYASLGNSFRGRQKIYADLVNVAKPHDAISDHVADQKLIEGFF